MEVKGPGNGPAYDSCDAVLEFMARRKLTIGLDDELLDLGISDDLVRAVSAEKVQVLRVILAGAEWKLRVAPGMLVGHSADATFSLHAQPDEEHDYFHASRLDGYVAVAKVRCELRKRCKEDPNLAAALISAFQMAEPVVRQDWFDLDA